MNAHAPADLRAGVNRDVRKQPRFVAEHGILADEIAGLQNAVRADLHPLANRAMRADVRGRINLRARGDDGGRMNAGGEFRFRKKQRKRLRERKARICRRE